MVERPYVPDAGDIVWLTFSPPGPGHEQAGRRSALVLSLRGYNGKTRLALACPITSRVKGYPFEVPLPPGDTVTGVVLADQVKNMDWRARGIRFEAVASPQVMAEVLEKLAVLLAPVTASR